MDYKRYRGPDVREDDAPLNPADTRNNAPEPFWASSTPADADTTAADPFRIRRATTPNVAPTAPPDETTADDQVTVLAERQPGASADALPAPPADARNSGTAPSPTAAAGSNSATLYDNRAQWTPPRVAPAPRPRTPQQAGKPRSHVPWQAAESWGPVTFTIEATTAAGASYLFWWLSGLLIYFNERHNRYVRFHAMQSILLTGTLTVVGVVGFVMSALCGDLASATGRHAYRTLGTGVAALTIALIVFPWLIAMVAAWTGNYLRLPIVGDYAERYAAPPIEPTPPPLY